PGAPQHRIADAEKRMRRRGSADCAPLPDESGDTWGYRNREAPNEPRDPWIVAGDDLLPSTSDRLGTPPFDDGNSCRIGPGSAGTRHEHRPGNRRQRTVRNHHQMLHPREERHRRPDQLVMEKSRIGNVDLPETGSIAAHVRYP